MRASTRPLRVAVLTITTMLLYGIPPAQADPPPPPAAPVVARPAGGAPAGAAGATPAGAARVIAWKVCPENAAVQCGTMRVPADWANPAGPQTLLTIARLPASDPKARIGALFVNPGGPGGSAVDFTFGAPTFFGKEVLRRFDIVGMDPRGVGRSSPVLCSQDLVDAKPSPLIESAAAYAATIDYNRRLAADCAKRTGPHFAHVDTASVVRDTDTVRAALGEQKISYYGASYGSLIGAQYSQMFPQRLRALVLDGVMDHSAGLAGFLIHETDAAQDSFREFVKWCARDKRCIVRGQNIDALWATLMARARAGTLVDPYDKNRKLRPSELANAAFAAFYDPQWYSFAYYLRDAAGLPGAKIVKPSPLDVVDHSFPAVFCEDWYLPITGYPDLRRRLNILRARAPQILASPLALSATAGCLGWPSAPDNPQRPLTPPVGMGPILLVNAVHDPATSYVWAQNVARQLGPQATLLTYRGWGHVIYDRSTCVGGLADRYLLTLAVPAAGSSCKPVEPQPFGVG